MANAARQGHPSAPREEASRVRRYMRKPDSFLVVAEDSGEMVGMAVGMQGLDVDGDGSEVPGLVHIGAVFVAPGRWGEGIGGGLVAGILGEARSRGYTRAQLWMHKDNVRARELYVRKGFVSSGRETTDDYGETIIHFETRL